MSDDIILLDGVKYLRYTPKSEDEFERIVVQNAKNIFGENAIYLDVRDPNEFAAGHLPGSINVSRGTLEFQVWNKITDPNAKIYVYCKTTGRSTLATKTMNDMGYKNAVLMDAQFEDWIKAGYPVER